MHTAHPTQYSMRIEARKTSSRSIPTPARTGSIIRSIRLVLPIAPWGDPLIATTFSRFDMTSSFSVFGFIA
jgi:hypothetical protein